MRSGVEIQVDLVFPTNPNFHLAHHHRGRPLGSPSQGVAREPVGDFHLTADSQHLDFCLLRIYPSVPGGTSSPSSALTEPLESGGKVATKADQLPGATFEVQAPKTTDSFFVQVADPRVAKIDPMHDQGGQGSGRAGE